MDPDPDFKSPDPDRLKNPDPVPDPSGSGFETLNVIFGSKLNIEDKTHADPHHLSLDKPFK